MMAQIASFSDNKLCFKFIKITKVEKTNFYKPTEGWQNQQVC